MTRRGHRPDPLDPDVVTLDFGRRRELLGGDAWEALRYYAAEGASVDEVLAFGRVRDVNPFEVGVDRTAERRAFGRERRRVVKELDLAELLDRPFCALSNGEMQRVVLAEAILKAPKRLVLVDPMSGLDPLMRQRLREIIDTLPARGISVTCRYRYADEKGDVRQGAARPPELADAHVRESTTPPPPVIEIANLSIRFGRRKLFSDFSWTVRRGERWVLRGPNGSGKTTLIALITGDSPLAYANDVKVFGIPRESGCNLPALRRRMAWVSPELQTSSGEDAFALLDAALAKEPELLLLDEPCMNLFAREAKRLCRKVAAWLRRRPNVTAICVAHRPEHVPSGFSSERVL